VTALLQATIATTVTKRVKSGTDSLGNDVWTTTSVPLLAQAFDPGVSLEQVQGQDVITTQPTVYYPPGSDVAAIDAVTIFGRTYEVDGEPIVNLQSPFTGWQPGVIVRLKRVTG
jgi:hypothetical protein